MWSINTTLRIWEFPQYDIENLNMNAYFPGLTKQMLSDMRTSQCLTDASFMNDKQTLNALGILQLCLLKSEPFDFDGALTNLTHIIQDVRMIQEGREGPKRECQDRSKLLESLAEALLPIKKHFGLIYTRSHKRLRRLQRYTGDLGSILDVYIILRSDKIIRSRPYMNPPHSKAVKKAFGVIAQIVQSLGHEDYQEIMRYTTSRVPDNRIKLDLTTSMWSCFEDYGPRRYSKEATYHAIAAILRQFQIETGEQDTIVHRIRQRLRRYQKKQHPTT